MKNSYLMLFALVVFFGQLAIAAPTGTTLPPETIQINPSLEKKKLGKKRLILKERFQRWKAKIAVKILQKHTLKKEKQKPSDENKSQGKTGLRWALLGLLGLLLVPVILAIGSLGALVGGTGLFGVFAVLGILVALGSVTFGVMAFFKGLKGLKYDEDPKKAIAAIVLGSLFSISLLLFVILGAQL